MFVRGQSISSGSKFTNVLRDYLFMLFQNHLFNGQQHIWLYRCLWKPKVQSQFYFIPLPLVPWNRVSRGRGENIPLNWDTTTIPSHVIIHCLAPTIHTLIPVCWCTLEPCRSILTRCLLTHTHTHTHTHTIAQLTHPGAKKLVNAAPWIL